jgi:hypothetical protein
MLALRNHAKTNPARCFQKRAGFNPGDPGIPWRQKPESETIWYVFGAMVGIARRAVPTMALNTYNTSEERRRCGAVTRLEAL